MFEIVGEYEGQIEVLDTAETYKEAEFLKSEYRIAFGNSWIIKIEKLQAEKGKTNGLRSI